MNNNIQKENKNKLQNFYKDFLLGGIAGTISKTSCAPIERIKILLQVNASLKKQGKPLEYEGILGCASSIYQKQGILGFWKGNMANLIRYFPTTAINFSVKDYLNQFFLQGVDSKKNKLQFAIGNIMAGGCAGMVSMFIVYPLDFARTRLGADHSKKPEFNGIWDCLSKVYKKDGIKGIYNGLFMSIVGIFIYRGLQFGFYDTGKQLIQQNEKSSKLNENLLFKFLFAQSIVIISETISFPLDTIKRRLMMQSGNSNLQQVEFNGNIDCIRKIYKQEGYQGFFKGLVPNIYRSVGSSLVLVLYDQFKHQWFSQIY